jgi:molecular chaperone DnaK
MRTDLDAIKGKVIIGIDLGTTKSGVSVWSDAEKRVVMLPDEQGRELMPSIVAWDRHTSEWLVGHAAKELLEQRPSDVVYSVKRYIGRWFTDPAVLRGHGDLTYSLVSGGGEDALRDVLVDFGGDASAPMQTSAPEISAKVLSALRHNAARSLGLALEDVSHAVITVPAYFNVLQRRATILAGQLAGLDVVDILNEPTAAALAYRDTVLTTEERRILVFDLGGGTFDISLLEARRDDTGYEFFTRIVDGDTRLGGDDIDRALAHHLAGEIQRSYGDPVPASDRLTRSRLRLAAERAKIALSTSDRVTVELADLALPSRSPFNARVEIARATLEECAIDVVRRTRAIAKRAVEDVASLGWADIDEVILVGGQTLMPAVQREVEELSGRPPRVNDRPQLVVALGAGEYAHILSLGREKFQENALLNVMALPLGIRLDDDTFKHLVEANVTVPTASRPYPITTADDFQKHILVEVLQGPRDATSADQCVRLGSIDMEVPPAPARTLKFEVELHVESDGTMKVQVADLSRKRVKQLDIVEKAQLAWTGQSLKQEPTVSAP